MDNREFEFLVNPSIVNVKWKHFNVFRRFTLNQEAGRVYEALVQKCNELVPTGDYEIAWIDEEGDPIHLSSEADLIIAIKSMNDSLLRIHSIPKAEEPKKTEAPAENIHPGIQCDLCDAFIIGTRFKCLLCADYDLCQKCEKTAAHKHHAMLRIVDPNETIVPWGGRLRSRGLGGGWGTGQQEGCRRFGRRHHGGPFHQPGLFDDHQENIKSACKKMEEKREDLMRHLESDEWKKTCKNGMDFLNNVGQQIQQALANFGIDATVESMEVRPPNEPPKKETTETEPKGSDVELVTPKEDEVLVKETTESQIPKEEKLLDSTMNPTVNATAPSEPPKSSAIPMPAPMPIPYAVPMPPPPQHPAHFTNPIFDPFAHPWMPPHHGFPQQQTRPMMPRGAPRDLHVSATLHGPMMPGPVPPVPEARIPTNETHGPAATDANIYPQINHRPQLPQEDQQQLYHQLVRMGFGGNVHVEEAARRFPNDINQAIDYLYNH